MNTLGIDFLQWVHIIIKSPHDGFAFLGKLVAHLAQVLEERGVHQGLLVKFDRNLGHFHQKLKQESGNIDNLLAHDFEKVPELICGHGDEIDWLHFARLVPDVFLVVNVVVFAQQLQESECPPVCGLAVSVVDDIVG